MRNFLFELDRNRRVDLSCFKERLRCADDQIVIALRDCQIVAAKLDSLFRSFIDSDRVVERNRHDERVELVETIVPSAENFQRKIDLRGSEDLHSSLQFVLSFRAKSRNLLSVDRNIDPAAAGDFARHDKVVAGMTKAADKFIVALDVPTKKEALKLVEKLRDQISFFKIGLQLYTEEGPAIVRAVSATGSKVWLDLKLHDIPNTVAKAVESASRLGVQMLTIHLSGGSEMVRAATAARINNMLLLGVTVLTSATEETLREIGIQGKIDDQVLRLAKLGVEAGIDGVVASPHEIKSLRLEFGNKIRIVVPGIRPSWSEPGDQRRTMTPCEALEAGADYLVIGRPIVAHPNPNEAVAKVLGEMNR